MNIIYLIVLILSVTFTLKMTFETSSRLTVKDIARINGINMFFNGLKKNNQQTKSLLKVGNIHN